MCNRFAWPSNRSIGVGRQCKTLSIVDDRGTTIEVPANPKRIASISYFATDVAFALGVKPVATTYMAAGREPDFLLGLTKQIKQIGQRAKPNLELLSEAKPDIIIAMRRYTIGNAEQLQKIAPYVAYNMELLSESDREISQLAQVLGKPERGTELNAAFRQHLAEYSTKAPKDVHPRFQIMWAGDTPWSFHTENTTASIVAALGGDNIAGPMRQGGPFGVELSLETMLEKTRRSFSFMIPVRIVRMRTIRSGSSFRRSRMAAFSMSVITGLKPMVR